MFSIDILFFKVFYWWFKNCFGSVHDSVDRYSWLRFGDCYHPCISHSRCSFLKAQLCRASTHGSLFFQSVSSMSTWASLTLHAFNFYITCCSCSDCTPWTLHISKPANPSFSQSEVKVLKLKLCQQLPWPYCGHILWLDTTVPRIKSTLFSFLKLLFYDIHMCI